MTGKPLRVYKAAQEPKGVEFGARGDLALADF
jgi:hypothetical protein